MNEISFRITNEPWTNLGILTLSQELSRQNMDVQITYQKDSVSFKSEKNFFEIISDTLHNFTIKGTYNLNQSLKIINLNNQLSNYDFQKPTKYKENKEKIEILPDEIKYLKTKKHNDTARKQQIWKQRLSYISDYVNYLKYGIKYHTSEEYKKLSKLEQSKEYCSFCNLFYKLSNIKASFNPLVGEHHNNKIDGIDESSTGRLNIKICPICFTASLFSLFNSYIPFFQIGQGNKRKTILALPKTVEVNVLKKIVNNLSLGSQHIDFNKPQNYFYSTNIKNIVSDNYAGSLISLLNNILNFYNEGKITEDSLYEITEEEFAEITEWIFINKDSKKIKYIKANNKIYNILKPITLETTGEEITLINVIKKFPFGRALENDIENFYTGILKIDIKKIGDSIFIFSKQSLKQQQNSNIHNLKVFKDYFIELIAEEVIMLEDNKKKAIKNIAETIAKGFCNEIGMLTKFAYSTDNKDFKSALEEALFKLAKLSILEGKTQYVVKENLEIIFDILEDKNYFSDIKNYFICFMSLQVIIENYSKNKK